MSPLPPDTSYLPCPRTSRARISHTLLPSAFFFFFNDTAPTEIYPLPLHAPLPIYLQPLPLVAQTISRRHLAIVEHHFRRARRPKPHFIFITRHAEPGKLRLDQKRGHAARAGIRDRKSTRLNSSHLVISYAVFCLKK